MSISHGEPDKEKAPDSVTHWRVLLSLTAIAVLTILNWLLFRIWHMNYFLWYLRNGALINIVFGFVTLAGADPNRTLGLISANPARYLEACLTLTIWPELATSASLDAGLRGRRVIDALLLVPVSLCLLLAVGTFLLVVVPLQYFVYLVCGPPGRVLHDSQSASSFWVVEGDRVRTEILKSPRGELPKELDALGELKELREKILEVEQEAKIQGTTTAQSDLAQLRAQADQFLDSIHVHEVKFQDEPVKLTAAFSTLVLWVIGQFLL